VARASRRKAAAAGHPRYGPSWSRLAGPATKGAEPGNRALAPGAHYRLRADPGTSKSAMAPTAAEPRERPPASRRA